MTGVALMIAASVAVALAHVAFKRSVGGRGALPWIAAGVGSYALSMGLMAAALAWGPLTRLAPLASLAVVWTALLARWGLRERVDGRRWIGVGLILLGSFLISGDC